MTTGDAFSNIKKVKVLLAEHGLKPSSVSCALDAYNEIAQFYFKKISTEASEELYKLLDSSGIKVVTFSDYDKSVCVSIYIGDRSKLFRNKYMEENGFSYGERCSRDSNGSLVLCEPLSRLYTGIWKDSVYTVERDSRNKIKHLRFASGYSHTAVAKYCPFCGESLVSDEEDHNDGRA